MTGPAHEPFAEGSISLGLYLEDLDATSAVHELLHQARLAEEAGFDGVTLSEHHGGFEGYVPTPVLGCCWLLDVLGTAWAAPCPVILPLRPVNLLLEELAWLAARHPGRVGAGFAPGFAADDFALAGAAHETRRADFYRALPKVVAALRGEAGGPLGDDRAVRVLADRPVPVLGAVAGPVAAAKVAAAGAGSLVATFKSPAQARELTEIHNARGGTGPRVLIRRCWLGPRPASRGSTAPRSAPRTWANGDRTDMVRAETGAELAAQLHAKLVESGTTALNIRLQLPGSTVQTTRDQIVRFGTEVLPALRELIRSAPTASTAPVRAVGSPR
ncbi:Luciferase-like monooxygenase [Pseudonocardia thermophila]|uniref:Luciferase-like monooxygenase n=1 Tax=Pseudonocardia thermophila TaxID=1848 RepID=A0A1M6XPL8_PSETH|nr:LLM class flavin-dependent oxidoreductase [Pseudonocardia thermophila]SHL07789.1 Luciferase-like monooxygenase [Pseudonocardia thermophila]